MDWRCLFEIFGTVLFAQRSGSRASRSVNLDRSCQHYMARDQLPSLMFLRMLEARNEIRLLRYRGSMEEVVAELAKVHHLPPALSRVSMFPKAHLADAR